MTNEGDLRWEQRFDNYQKALKKLSEAIDYVKNDLKVNESDLEIGDSYEVLEEIIKEGLIQRFEYTYELAWNMMKDYAMYQGNPEIGGSRDAIRYAFSSNLIARLASLIETFSTPKPWYKSSGFKISSW